MKTIVALGIVIGIGALFVLHGNTFLTSSYTSELMGLHFKFPSHLSVVSDSIDSISIEYPKPSSSKIVIRRIRLSDETSPLSFSLTRDFSSSVSKEVGVVWNMSGLSFYWKSPKGVEKGFAFTEGSYMYVVATIGAIEEKDGIRNMEVVAKSIAMGV